MFYYLYQITCKVNNKIYIGVHETNRFEDGYMGSGTNLKRAFTKHGIDNFEKTILEYFSNRFNMYAKEAEIVDNEFIKNSDVYNLVPGGKGRGFYYVNSTRDFTEHNKKIAIIRDYDSEEYKARLSEGTKLGLSKTINRGSKVGRAPTRGTTGKTWTETKKRTSNSQTGTMWITDGFKAIKIKKTDLIPDGYRKGRIIFDVAGFSSRK